MPAWTWRPAIKWTLTTASGRNIDITADTVSYNVKWGSEYRLRDARWRIYSARGEITVDNTRGRFSPGSSTSALTTAEWGQGAMVITLSVGGRSFWRGICLIEGAPELIETRAITWTLRGRYYSMLSSIQDWFPAAEDYAGASVQSRFEGLLDEASKTVGDYVRGSQLTATRSTWSNDILIHPITLTDTTPAQAINDYAQTVSHIPGETASGQIIMTRPKTALTTTRSNGTINYIRAPAAQRAFQGSLVEHLAPIREWGLRLSGHTPPTPLPDWQNEATITYSAATRQPSGVYHRRVTYRYAWPPNVYHVDWRVVVGTPSSNPTPQFAVSESGLIAPRGEVVNIDVTASAPITRGTFTLQRRSLIEDAPLDTAEVNGGSASAYLVDAAPWVDITDSTDVTEDAEWMVGIRNRVIPRALLRIPLWGPSQSWNVNQFGIGEMAEWRVSDDRYIDGITTSVELDWADGRIPMAIVEVHDLAGVGLRPSTTATRPPANALAGKSSVLIITPGPVTTRPTNPSGDIGEQEVPDPPDDPTPPDPEEPTPPEVAGVVTRPGSNPSDLGGDSQWTWSPGLFYTTLKLRTMRDLGSSVDRTILRADLRRPDWSVFGSLQIRPWTSSGPLDPGGTYDHTRFALIAPFVPRALGYWDGSNWQAQTGQIIYAYIDVLDAADNSWIWAYHLQFSRGQATPALTNAKWERYLPSFGSVGWSIERGTTTPQALNLLLPHPPPSTSTSAVSSYKLTTGETTRPDQSKYVGKRVYVRVVFVYSTSSQLLPNPTTIRILPIPILPKADSSGDATRAALIPTPQPGTSSPTLGTLTGGGNRWNGKPQVGRTNRFVVLHTAEGRTDGRDGHRLNVASYLYGLRDRYAGYHIIVDEGGWMTYLYPSTHRAYHARNGGNDGVGVGIACSTSSWATMSTTRRNKIFANVKAALTFHKVMPSSITRQTTWPTSNPPAGFYAHSTIQSDRSDPGSNFNWTSFLAAMR